MMFLFLALPTGNGINLRRFPPGLNSKLVGFYQENGFLFTPVLYIGGRILKRIIFVFSKRNEYEYE